MTSERARIMQGAPGMKYLVVRDIMDRLYYQSRLSGYESGSGSLTYFSALRESKDGSGNCREVALNMTGHIEHGEILANDIEQCSGGSAGGGRGFREYATGLGSQYGR